MDSRKAIRTSVFSIIGNVILSLIKFSAGIIGNSYALIADAIESTADVISSVLVLVGLKYSTKPPDENHPYGHGRFETLSTFAVVGFLIVSAGIIAYQSIINIIHPKPELPKVFTLYVLGGIILFKELAYRYVMKKSRETNSSSLMADAVHHRSDAVISILAFIGISIALFFGKGFETADSWAALAASIFILYSAYKVFRPVLSEISDEQLYDDMIHEIRAIAETVPGVVVTEKCHVRKMGMTFYVDLHMMVDGRISVYDGHEIGHALKREIINQMPQVADVLVHLEPDRLKI